MLSVLMSVYNEQQNDIAESINSILRQSYSDFELIIVFDNPNAKYLKSLLTEYANKDSRIIIVENKVNMGLAQSMNVGLEYCASEYIVRMDADDRCDIDRLKVLADEISRHRDVDVFYSEYRVIDSSGRLLKQSPSIPSSGRKLSKILQNYKNIICHPTVAMRKSALKKVGGYSDLRIAEDYELWLTLLRADFVFYGIKQSLVDIRVHENSMTTSNYYKSNLALEFIKRRSKKNKRVSNREFENYFRKKSKYAKRYNYYGQQYFRLVNKWPNENNLKLLKLVYLLIMEPSLIRYCYETYRAVMLRRA